MKTLPVLIFGLLSLCVTSNISVAQNISSQPVQVVVPAPTPYAITTQDANSRVWQRTDYQMSPSGEVITNTHSVTEICSGLNHWAGQWVASSEKIDILPNGTAVATNGQHQASFPGDIYQGQIQLLTPNGQLIQSRPLALAYFDGTNTVVIAELTNSIGVVVGNNQVVYPNAFNGLLADLQYVYTKSGFSQNVVIKQQPPTPESLGLNADTARLQIMTEFFSPPQPTIQSTSLPVQAGLALTDESLDFGTMQMVPGRAFLLGQDAPDSGALVSKHWVQVDGRQILIEEVPVDAILEGLAALPLTAMNSSSHKNAHTASKHFQLPPQRLTAKNTSKTMMLAKADFQAQGLVLDYQIVNSTQTNYTFRADTTYEVGAITLKGTNTFEGGSVIKYTSNGSIALLVGAGNPGIIWNGSAYRPVIFTSINDNSVGETISTSTGNPTNFCGNPMLNLVTLSSVPTLTGIRMNHAITALQFSGASANIYDAQFLNCQYGISGVGANITLRNALYVNVNTNFNGTGGGFGINAQNVTCSRSACLLASPSSPLGITLALTNCIFANVTNLSVGFATPAGSYNGFYSCSTFGTSTYSSSVYPFQSVGAGSSYLANGCGFLNVGTTNIDPTWLVLLKQKTTYPPILYSNITVSINTALSPQAQRDTDTPDLGYHYDPIDYVVDQFTITNATLTINNGVVIASYNEPGIQLLNGSTIISIGTALAPNWFVRYQSVQEQSIALGGTNVFNGEAISSSGYPSAMFQFSKFACPAGGGHHLCDTATSTFSSLWVQSCEFWSGMNDFSGTNVTSVATLMNDLFWRSTLYASNNSAAATLNLTNNLAFGTSITLSQPGSGLWTAFNNDFDTCMITNSTLTNGYNAYFNCSGYVYPTNATDIFSTNALVFQTGPLGTFYQPSTSPLIDKGSTTADQVGLYHYTTQTALYFGYYELPEATSTVDIGYHYIAVDANGNPLDDDGDGIPDYLEDANGNGLVDSGETDWQNASDLGLKIWITRPRIGATIP